MTRKKLQHFAQMKTFPNVFEEGFPSDPTFMKGKWLTHFQNDHPLVLELACGRGTHTVALAERFSEKNFIGMDIKGSRLWHGCTAALERNVPNVAFVRGRIENLIAIFDPGEVDELWVTFPDPHPREGKAVKRLTSPRFLKLYRTILKPGGTLHFKTDHGPLFEYSLESLTAEKWQVEEVIRDIYHAPKVDLVLTELQTTYEQRHLALGRTIHYLKALA